jgi:hypothetical protein
MNSIPQQAVTNGYEKREYLRAHARALSRVVVRKPDWSGVENIARIPFCTANEWHDHSNQELIPGDLKLPLGV